MTYHPDAPELLDAMNSVYNNISYDLAILQHRDWDNDTCIFNLRERDRFIEKSLEWMDEVPKDCGACMLMKMNLLTKWFTEVFTFYGIGMEDRFGEAFHMVFDKVMKEHDEDVHNALSKIM